MNHREVALSIELAHKVDDHLYPRVILLTVSLLTVICLFLIFNLMRIILLVLVYLALNVQI
jgi:hypothetical protein